ncbi:MAG TPA: hypothetical protein VFE62_25635 [Gemmataceae bacterium]|nr:hypothetical protein [Gemmataceae bacterium]
MAVTLQCARCMHEQKVDDDKVEKGVPCKICHNLIKPGAKAKTKVSGSKNEKEKDEGIKSGPPSTKQSTAKKSTPTRMDDDDDDEKPKSKPSKSHKTDDDDDDDRPAPRKRKDKEESSSMLFILLGGGALVVLFLLCAGGGTAAYFMFGSDGPKEQPIAQVDPVPENPVNPFPNPPVNPFPNPNPVNPFPNPPVNPFPNPPVNPFQPPEELDPNDPTKIDRVIQLLKGPKNERGSAYKWLRNANPEVPRRSEVAVLLDPIVPEEQANPFAFAGDFFPAYFKWATKDNVASLKRMAENTAFNPSDNGRRQEAMLALGRLKEPSAVDNIVSKLDNAFDGDAANRALTAMGTVAEPAVLKLYNHPNGGARDRARNLLKAYGTPPDKILTQCIADLGSDDGNRRGGAVQYLANATVDQKRRPEVAKALNKSIANVNFFFEKDFAKLIETWGTSENVPPLIQRLERPQGDRDAIRILGKLKDVNGTKAIARAMGNFFMEGECKAALKEYGPNAEPFVVEAMFMAKDNRARGPYVRYLGENGTLRIGGVALNQLAFQNQQDRGFQLQLQQAFKQIQARGR